MPTPMLTLQQALSQCLDSPLPRRVERAPLGEADGRILAEDLHAPSPLPRWDNSAMDGYAVRVSDFTSAGPDQPGCGEAAGGHPVTARLTVTQTIAAGTTPAGPVLPGTAARIMTGAPMPEGADAVVMREHTAVHALPDGSEQVWIHGTPRAGQHIRRAGEEIRAGQRALPAGSTLTPAAIGLCATLGLTEVAVAVRPRVAIIATGDEVVRPGQPLQPGQLYSSNTPALMSMVRAAGGVPIDCGIAPDTLEGTSAVFRAALATGCDLLLSTGGVSVGDFDVVKEALADVGAKMAFWKVRIKPGKPLAMGVIGGKPALALPGNPVSCLVNFLQFVRPLIRTALGDPRPFLPAVPATLQGDVRKRAGRAELIRVTLSWEDGQLMARTTGSQSSGQVSSMAIAHGLLLLGIESTGAADGETLPVQVFDTGFLAAATPQYPW